MHLQKIIYILACFLTAMPLATTAKQKVAQPPMKLWYEKPAAEWMTSALPIGNGELGAMFFGGVEQEHIQFNEKTLWTGSRDKRGAYQNFGDLYLKFDNPGTYVHYRRELNLDNATGSVSYQQDGICFLREYFASFPDSVLVLRLSTPGNKKKLNFSVALKDAHPGNTTIENDFICMRGKLDLVSYCAQAYITNEGGVKSIEDNRIRIEGASAVTILLAAGTNYDIQSDTYTKGDAGQLYLRIKQRIEKAATRTYRQLKRRHQTDYCSRFNRVKMNLHEDLSSIPTDILVNKHRESSYLDMLYFQYGRYLMLGSSRGMGLPNNLQGIWNNNNTPPWESDIHTNINIQMNYWPAETTHLSECHLPLLNYLYTEALRKNGSFTKVARKEDNRGWAVHTQTNIFSYTDWNINRPANAWYCMHLWQHYTHTRDLDYLEKIAFPVMKSTCEYWFDRLKYNGNGKLVAPHEWSPEQGGWSDNVAYAQQLIWELFSSTLEACQYVKPDPEFTEELKKKLASLDNGVTIGSWGQIREWETDEKQLDVYGNEHRHLSNLMALFPGTQISYLKDKTIADAAKKTLLSRGDKGTGWSRAWKISCWARLLDGNHAYKLLKSALNLTTMTRLSMMNSHGGIYENLLDAHPPFQIDGNFGATAGIAEMLLQSHLGEVHLLPTLPDAWEKGGITGLKANGNFEIDIKWEKQLLERAEIYSGSGESCTLRTTVPVQIKGTKATQRKEGDYFLNTFQTKKGKRYKITVLQP